MSEEFMDEIDRSFLEHGDPEPMPIRLAKAEQLIREIEAANSALRARCAELEAERDAAKAEAADMQALFDLQRKRMVVADHMWRKAHPEEKMTWPDLGQLLEWLMQQIDSARAGEARAVEAIQRFKNKLRYTGNDASEINRLFDEASSLSEPALDWLDQQRREAVAEWLSNEVARWVARSDSDIYQASLDYLCATAAALRAGKGVGDAE